MPPPGRVNRAAGRCHQDRRTGRASPRDGFVLTTAAREAADAPDALHIGLGAISDNARPFAAEHRIAIWQAPELAHALRALPPG